MLVQAVGASAWLTAPLARDGCAMEPTLFRVVVRRRSRLPVFLACNWCSSCASLMDRYGDHASTRPCKGDRSNWRNTVRNIIWGEVRRWGLLGRKGPGFWATPAMWTRRVGDGGPPTTWTGGDETPFGTSRLPAECIRDGCQRCPHLLIPSLTSTHSESGHTEELWRHSPNDPWTSPRSSSRPLAAGGFGFSEFSHPRRQPFIDLCADRPCSEYTFARLRRMCKGTPDTQGDVVGTGAVEVDPTCLPPAGVASMGGVETSSDQASDDAGSAADDGSGYAIHLP